MKKNIVVLFPLVLLTAIFFGAAYAADAPKVAMSLTGPINDQSWNQAGYEGLMMIKDKLGAEVAFQERVPLSNVEESLRNYAAQGYNIVIGMGDQYSEAGKVVAEEYPDVIVIVMSGIYSGDNLIATAMFDEEIAYVAGVTAALMSKTGVIGYIGGMEIPPVIRNQTGYENGAKATNPDIEVKSAVLGDFADAAKGKEAAAAMIEQGVDIIYYYVDNAMLGIFEAAHEAKDVKLIGIMYDQSVLAPDLIITSVLQNTAASVLAVTENALNGDITGEVQLFGMASGATGLAPFSDTVPQDVQDKVNAVMDQILSGELVINRE